MGRRSTVRFATDRGGYYTEFQGRKQPLFKCKEDDRPHGPNYREALAKLDRLIKGLDEAPGNEGHVGLVIGRYLDWLDSRGKPSARDCRDALQPFKERYGHLDVDQLRGHHVTDWAEGRKDWGDTTKHGFCKKLKTAFRFSQRRGHLKVNPLADFRTEDHYVPLARGAEFVIPKALQPLLLAWGLPHWQFLQQALKETGARPGELYNAEGFNLNHDDRTIFYEANPRRGYKWKNAGRKKYGDGNRTIYLSEEVYARAAENARRTGLLFPGRKGGRWSDQMAWDNLDRMRCSRPVREWLIEHDRRPGSVVIYSWRHTYITEALVGRVSIKLVADLCGTSVAEIEKTYSHALSDKKGMRGVADDIRRLL